MTKKVELYNLAQKRKESKWIGYKNIGDYHNGVYECNYVSPYSKSAHNVNANIMIFLQDLSSDDSMSKEIKVQTVKLGYTPTRATNIKLIKLLRQYFNLNLEDVYATNLFPFIKMGSMSAKIPSKDMVMAAKEFGFPQIDIINPKIAICLGLKTFNAFRKVLGLKKASTIEVGINDPFKYKNTLIYCQAHTGTLGQNNRNKYGIDRVSKDWEKMSNHYS